ncbi:unnamed protein product [Calypogeia fissa]
MSQVTTKAFYNGLIDSLYPVMHKYSVEMIRWSRLAAKEVTKLNNQLEEIQPKYEIFQVELAKLNVEKAQWETVRAA